MHKKIDLLLSFDTTGSMYPVLAQVRQAVKQFLNQMFTEFCDLRIGIIAHGDYCDKDNPYTIKIMDFTNNESTLCKFVSEVEKTFGGDADECYELVLNAAYTNLTWRDDADKVMIMIGDASPHSVNYTLNSKRLDWVHEAEELRKRDIKVFAVHALSYYRSSSKMFYKRVAEETFGVYLTLDQFNEVVELIKATCYQQNGVEKLDEYITIIRESGKLTNSMDRNFKRLMGIEVEDVEVYSYSDYSSGRASSSTTRRSKHTEEDVVLKKVGELVPVMPGRFQIMTVEENTAIKQFVEENGIVFNKGRGFYELSKAETVQQYKEVIMMDKETGEMFTGAQVRERLSLQPQSEKGGVNEKLHKSDTKQFRVFVQSTSVNRKLMAGTTFLYEINDLEDESTVVDYPVITEAKKEKADKKTEVTEAKKEKADKKTEVTEAKKEKADKKTEVTEAKKVSKTKKAISVLDKADVEKRAKEKALENDINKLLMQIANVKEGCNRVTNSKNKKNRTFLTNNIKKLNNLADKILDDTDY